MGIRGLIYGVNVPPLGAERQIFSCGGTGVPPVNHAQDARATKKQNAAGLNPRRRGNADVFCAG